MLSLVEVNSLVLSFTINVGENVYLQKKIKSCEKVIKELLLSQHGPVGHLLDARGH